MLVLSRERNEEIVITVRGLEIIVGVAEIHSNKVRIGIDAPREVTINRREVHESIKREGLRKPVKFF